MDMKAIIGLEKGKGRTLSLVPVVTSIVITLVGLGVMILGYILDIETFRDVVPNAVAMKFNTALCLTFSGLGLFSIIRKETKIIGILLFLIVIVIAGVNLLENLFDKDLGIDELFFKDYVGRSKFKIVPPGRLEITVALCFLLTSLSGILNRDNKYNRTLVQVIPLVVFLLAGINFMGYVFKMLPNDGSILISSMAIHTVLCFIILSLGLVFLSPQDRLPHLLLSRDSLGTLFRRAVAYMILLPIIVSSLLLALLKNEMLGLNVSLTLFSVVYTVAGLIALWTYVEQVSKLDAITTESEKTLLAQNMEISEINSELKRANELLQLNNAELKDNYLQIQEQSLTIERLLQDSLKLSEENYKQLFEAQPLPLLVYRLDNHKILAANNSAVEKYGYSVDEIIGLNFDVLHKDEIDVQSKTISDLPSIEGTMRRLKSQKHVKKDGSIMFVDSISHEFLYYGLPSRIKVINDITDKIETETRFQRLANSIQSIFFEVNEKYEYIFVNSFGLSYVNKTSEEMIGKNLFEVFPLYVGSEFEVKLRRCMDFHESTELKLVDGSLHNQIRYYDTYFYPTPTGVAIFSLDVTNQRNAEIELKENQQFINSLFSSVPSYIYFYNVVESRIEYNNDGLLGSLGYTGKELFNLKPEEYKMKLINPEDLPHIVSAIPALHRSTNTNLVENEYRMRAKNGSYHWVQDRTVPYSYDIDGNVIYLLGIITSIDEAKKYQGELMVAKAAAEEASEAKTNFLANMSHELRNPLNALLGITQLLERDYANDDKISKYVGLMRLSSNRLLSTIGNVLDLTKIESNITTINPSKVNITECVKKAIEIYRNLAEKKGLELVITNDDFADRIAFLDERLLEQILHNLLSNAIKFTSSGGVYISFSNEIIFNKNCYIIHIKDTGIGMNSDFVHNKLFGTFEQESTGMRKAYEGSGLGLHLAKKFTNLLGGSISVHSERNVGTVFSISFPQ